MTDRYIHAFRTLSALLSADHVVTDEQRLVIGEKIWWISDYV